MQAITQRRPFSGPGALRAPVEPQTNTNTPSAIEDPHCHLARAVIASEQSRAGASALWNNFLEVCRQNQQSVTAVLFSAVCSDRKSPVERVLASSDWTAKVLLFDIIPEGDYLKGRISRTEDGLYEVFEGKKSGYGVERNSLRTYCGQFLEGKKHGEGCQLYITKDGYVGEWREDYPCGWGTMYPPGNPEESKTGLFYHYMYLGNPKKPSRLGPMQALSLLAEKCGFKRSVQDGALR